MKYRFVLMFITCSIILAACGNRNIPVPTSPVQPSPVPTDAPISTPDPCAAENLEESIKQVNDLMREFDDASQLAASVAKEQVPPIISDMQRIRRAAEDQKVAACLVAMKTHQLAHMNRVIETMLAFVSGADVNSLSDGLSKAREEHDLYTMEIVSLLGMPATAKP